MRPANGESKQPKQWDPRKEQSRWGEVAESIADFLVTQHNKKTMLGTDNFWSYPSQGRFWVDWAGLWSKKGHQLIQILMDYVQWKEQPKWRPEENGKSLPRFPALKVKFVGVTDESWGPSDESGQLGSSHATWFVVLVPSLEVPGVLFCLNLGLIKKNRAGSIIQGFPTLNSAIGQLGVINLAMLGDCPLLAL
jgi:hypothetical protein